MFIFFIFLSLAHYIHPCLRLVPFCTLFRYRQSSCPRRWCSCRVTLKPLRTPCQVLRVPGTPLWPTSDLDFHHSSTTSAPSRRHHSCSHKGQRPQCDWVLRGCWQPPRKQFDSSACRAGCGGPGRRDQADGKFGFVNFGPRLSRRLDVSQVQKPQLSEPLLVQQLPSAQAVYFHFRQYEQLQQQQQQHYRFQV